MGTSAGGFSFEKHWQGSVHMTNAARELDHILTATTADWRPPTGLRDWHEDVPPAWITCDTVTDVPTPRQRLWGVHVRWSIIEVARADWQYRAEGALLKLAIDLDDLAYLGDKSVEVPGLLNQPRAGRLTLHRAWSAKDETAIIDDIDTLLMMPDERAADGSSTVGRSTALLLPISLYATLTCTRCSALPWEGGILPYVASHNLYHHIYKEPLPIYCRRHVTAPLLYARSTVAFPVSRPRWSAAVEHKDGSLSSELYCFVEPVHVGRPELLREVRGA
jgi:hypothetical protein